MNKIKQIKDFYERKNCASCKYIYAALSWWCINDNAINDRGTSIPGCIHCPYWQPDKEYIRGEIGYPNGIIASIIRKLIRKFKCKVK